MVKPKWYVHKVEYCSVIKSNVKAIHGTTCIHLCSEDEETVRFDDIEEKRIWRQQMSQALAEFHHCRRVNIQQTTAMIDATCSKS